MTVRQNIAFGRIRMLTVREVENKDLLPLAEFLPRGFPYTTKDFWPPLFELWWTTNPAYRDQFPRGWILENETSIVGFIGNIPVHFMVHGVVQTAALSNSWLRGSQSPGDIQYQAFQ